MLDAIKEKLDEQKIVDLIRDMVKIQTHPGIDGQETKLAEFIRDYFKEIGISADVTHVIDGRSNVLAKMKSEKNGKRLLFCGHLDTVPPYDMSDPYNARIVDGSIYGRGAVDMKSQLACMMEAMRITGELNVPLNGDVMLAGVIDEEHRSLGAIDLVERGLDADFAIIGEPTSLRPCVYHMGLEWFEFNIIGRAVHGGNQKEGINAIEIAAKFLNMAEQRIKEKLRLKTHPMIGTGTMNYGRIAGGTQPSTVAAECMLQIDRRWLPGESYDDVLADFNQIIDELKAEYKTEIIMKIMPESLMKEGFIHPPLATGTEDTNVREVIQRSLGDMGAGRELTFFPAWSDAGLLYEYGKMPCVVLGPGELKSAHTLDEHIAISDILDGTLLYALIISNFQKYGG
jgi:acetylornithine deacetylase/succinyl-diaminopimelate desuccinylase